MAYTVPRVEITQQFVAAPLFSNNPLAAFIFGPNYNVFQLDDTDSRQWTNAGAYATAGAAAQPWPRLVVYPNERVDVSKDDDHDFRRVTARLEGAFARYLPTTGTAPTGGTVTAAQTNMKAVPTGATNGYHPRQLQSVNGALYLFTAVHPVTGEVYPRNAHFSNRDVQMGDWVKVTNGTLTLFTRITALHQGSDGKPTILETADQLFAVGGAVPPPTSLFDPATTDTTPLAISLYLRGDFDMPSGFFVSAGTTETTYDVEASTAPAAKVHDPFLLTAGGSPADLEVGIQAPLPANPPTAATLLLGYRTLRTDNASRIQSISDISQVEERLGPVSPANPLAQGVYDCLLNAGGSLVFYMGVPTDDVEGYNVVLAQAQGTNRIYGLVPLTFNPAVLDAVKAHVTAMSEPAAAKWRKVWLCRQPLPQSVLPGFGQAAPGVVWTISAISGDPSDPTNANVQQVTVDSTASDPDFLTGGVRAGDWLRVYADGTLSGNSNLYEILAVNGATRIKVAATAGQVLVGKAIQIVRRYSQDEQVDLLVAANGNDRRVNQVFPHWTANGGVDKEGFFLAAALAGLRAGSLPHQPLTNAEVLGFDDLTLSTVTFTSDQLDRLASAGTWIVKQDIVGGVAYVRHQLTTAGYDDVGDDPKFSEDSLTTNVDSISYSLQRALEPFIGRYNVNPATVALVTATITRQMHQHMTNSDSPSAGPQLLGFNLVRVGQSELFRDRIEAVVELTLPFPLNKVTVTLIVP
jgi:hypothetical protein